jgi:hypothetical protein
MGANFLKFNGVMLSVVGDVPVDGNLEDLPMIIGFAYMCSYIYTYEYAYVVSI